MSEQTPRQIAQDCPCNKPECPIWGDCEACVRGHREHGDHVPQCMQQLLRGLVSALAHKVEYEVVDKHPDK